ncbi:MAG: molecular chaperone HtpG [Verrucomicrobiales bacterium]|jgi:molecular chaperone HtpG|nr:molecular chaperone HtpG [Verrucomicrobiales bacterium]|tara:strand:+ start:1272 stop:3197 length:1926 start_codon:yes stop_codon:yes gene_type:complete
MATEKKEFKTEVQQLLDLVIHSLYSNKDIFLRELISNSSDAIDKLRFNALSNKELLNEQTDFRIKLYIDNEAKTLVIEDNGIGMTKDELEANIGTIASSGTRKFMEEIKKGNSTNNPELIGQFGVGFYSAFMVADKVTMKTRPAGGNNSWTWESSGDGSYEITEGGRDEHGTEITLSLKEDCRDYIVEFRLREIIKKYSDFVEYPILMDITREEPELDEEGNPKEGAEKKVTITEETLNSMKAIWMRPKNEVKKEEYNEFYKHISHDYTDPLKTVHYSAEGTLEFKALLYLPSKAPFDMFQHEGVKHGINLYVKRVFIMDNCEALVPRYLRFVKGVVESNDLPLNVSREILQEDLVIKKIEKNVTSKILATLKDMMKKSKEDYIGFYKEFGKVIKEGVEVDPSNKDKIKDLLLFESSKSKPGEYISLKEYTDRMLPEQKNIYFLTGDSRSTIENSPHLEVFKKKDVEVLFMTEPVDEFILPGFGEYSDKSLKSIAQGDIDLGTEEEKKIAEEQKKEVTGKYKNLIKKIEESLKDDVKEVRLSDRLTDSPSCLVTDEGDINPQMERIFAAMNQPVPEVKRILEINPDHPVIEKMNQIFETDKKDSRVTDFSELLHNQALLTEGVAVKDPVRFSKLISDLMIG